jgi:hypothetical protein
MSLVKIQSNASGTGTLTIAAPNTNTDYTLTLPQATTTIVGTDATQTLTNKTINGGALQSGTAVTCSGQTSIDFTGIPSWVKRITVMFSGVSTSGTSNIQVQLGDAGGVETTGYSGAMVRTGASALATAQYPTTGFLLVNDLAAADLLSGNIVFAYIGSNIWTGISQIAEHAATSCFAGSGTKTLSDTLTQVRITTVNGTDTFDAGTINILYE